MRLNSVLATQTTDGEVFQDSEAAIIHEMEIQKKAFIEDLIELAFTEDATPKRTITVARGVLEKAVTAAIDAGLQFPSVEVAVEEEPGEPPTIKSDNRKSHDDDSKQAANALIGGLKKRAAGGIDG